MNSKISFNIEPYGKLSFEGINNFDNLNLFKEACQKFIDNFESYQDLRHMSKLSDFTHS